LAICQSLIGRIFKKIKKAFFWALLGLGEMGPGWVTHHPWHKKRNFLNRYKDNIVNFNAIHLIVVALSRFVFRLNLTLSIILWF